MTTQQFFAAVDQRNRNVPTENLVTPAEVCEGENIEAPNVSTSTVTSAITSITTPPVPLEVEIRGTSSPRISLPEGSPSHPTVTATCRPRTWMQQLTEGQINKPQGEDASSSENDASVVETLPEEIPDELGHEWRVLHPIDLPGVRNPTETTSQTKEGWQRMTHWWNLSKQQNIWMIYPPGDKETTDFTPLIMVTLSIEEEVEE